MTAEGAQWTGADINELRTYIKSVIDGSGSISVDSATISGDLTVDTDTLYVDSDDNRVGIGTTTPYAKLNIVSGTTSGEAVRVDRNDGTRRLFTVSEGTSSSNAGDIGIWYGSSENIRLDAGAGDSWINNGNVGIGTTSPSAKLEVVGTGSGLVIDHNGNGVGLEIDSEATSDQVLNIIAGHHTSNPTNGAFYMSCNTTGLVIGQSSTTDDGGTEYYDGERPALFLKRASSSRGVNMQMGNTNGSAALYTGNGTFLNVFLVGPSDSTTPTTFAGGFSAVDAVNNDVTLRLGSYYLWVDSTGDLRIKSSEPSTDTDGTVVGTQS